MKMPPLAKIYEAFSVLADQRITLESKKATIISSNKKKDYTVIWNEKQISSNDNATVWQRYPGYPIIAVWLLKGNIKFDNRIVKYFKNINWHELNKQNKRDYTKGINEVLNKLAENGVNTEKIEQEVDKIFEQLLHLNYEIVRKIK